MNSRLYFMVAFVFKITASQNFTHSKLLGTELILTCETDDLSQAILFKLGTDNKGGCIGVGSCDTVITGYETPTQQGTTITKMKITLCNETRDIGSWTCTYGGLTSDPVIITTCSGDTNTINKTNTSTDNDGIAFAILIVCLLAAYFIVITIRFCTKSTENTSGNCFFTFCQFIEEKFFDCCGIESRQEIEGDPGFFKDKVLTLNSLLGFTYLVLYGFIVEVIVLLAVYYGFAKFQEGLVIGVGFGMVLVLSFLCLLVVVWMLLKFVNNGASEKFSSLSCIKNCTVTPHETGKSQKSATIDKRQQPDGDEGSQSTPKETNARVICL